MDWAEKKKHKNKKKTKTKKKEEKKTLKIDAIFLNHSVCYFENDFDPTTKANTLSSCMHKSSGWFVFG